MSADRIEDFVSITGASKDRAKFFLEAANGDLDAAIGNFYEGGGDTNDDVGANNLNSNQNRFLHDDDDDDSDNEEEENEILKQFKQSSSSGAGPAGAESKASGNKSTASAARTGKVFTLRDAMGNEDDEEEDNAEKGQAFYAGGSETSGQQILGPPKKTSDNIIKDLFRKAKEHGAQEVDQSDPQSSSSSKKSPVVYGTGYRLGTGDEPSEVIQGPSKPKPPKVHILKLWKNGFTVDDGALRSYSDAQNKEFLEAIEKGAPPRELLRQAEGAEVNLDMQDHRDEEYVPPKNKYVLYNDGYKLGSPTPTVVSNASPNDQAKNENLAKSELSVDESKPVTQIQVRLSNGSRLIIKANQTHKIKDLRRYINRARPEYSQRGYTLLQSFPNKEITNEEETLLESNLLNSVIIQSLKE